MQVSGKRVGIVRLGRIGSLVARRLAAFGCSVAYHSKSPKPSIPFIFFPSVRVLAGDSDALVLCCALTEDTRHMVNREVMEALGKDGVLINVGRGGLVDEAELVRCLREGGVSGAGLDVYENEPDVPPELFSMDNVVLSDHRAVNTPESIAGVLDVVVANLDAFFSIGEACTKSLSCNEQITIKTTIICLPILSAAKALIAKISSNIISSFNI